MWITTYMVKQVFKTQECNSTDPENTGTLGGYATKEASDALIDVSALQRQACGKIKEAYKEVLESDKLSGELREKLEIDMEIVEQNGQCFNQKRVNEKESSGR